MGERWTGDEDGAVLSSRYGELARYCRSRLEAGNDGLQNFENTGSKVTTTMVHVWSTCERDRGWMDVDGGD